MNSYPIKVMIADDHSMVREGIKHLIELEGDIIVTAEASDTWQCIYQLEKKQSEILLLDVNMPSINGLWVLQYVKANKLDIKVIIVSINDKIEYLKKAIELGVDGYILKESDSQVLKKAIKCVYEGKKYIQPELLYKLKYDYYNKKNLDDCCDSELTKREIAILKLISEGLLNKEIAYLLNISDKTVKNHISNIFRKLNVSDRTQAAVYAIKTKLVDLELLSV